MAYADMNQRPRLIAGLRALAAYLEVHPEIPAPTTAELMVFTRGSDHAKRVEIDRIAALIGSKTFGNDSSSSHYRAARDFGPVTYSAVAIPNADLANHNALMSYDGAVNADTSEGM
ncbi:hypothetical protein GCM10022254_32760 [Actinomadura meridiana]|uniref:Uncharacterized protein n=1 Tax=Actinomadura meridiana TaxID=559626 RepID=A0ABP8C2V3_9ACTN